MQLLLKLYTEKNTSLQLFPQPPKSELVYVSCTITMPMLRNTTGIEKKSVHVFI